MFLEVKTVFSWHYVNKGTTQGSVSGPYSFNLFINDLNIDSNSMTHLIISMPMTLLFKLMLMSVQLMYLEWSEDNCMPCNFTKCNELCIQKKCKENYSPVKAIGDYVSE